MAVSPVFCNFLITKTIAVKLFLQFLIPLFSLLLFSPGESRNPPLLSHYKVDKPGLFDTDSILQFTISGNMRDIMKDRDDDAVYHPIMISYTQNGKEIKVPLKCKTRGNFRRDKSNCTYPPIMLNFSKINAANTLFEGQDKLKLVMPCRGDEYVVREYLVYKLYNLVTPKSFRARMVNVHLYDSSRNKETDSFYGFLLEEEDQMAERNKMKIIDKKMIRPESTETETFLKMAVFQYLIGNTDWSLPYLHNTRILAFDSLSVPYVVPYDFDHAGLVEAPYAMPPEELKLTSTRERRYRGYCISDLNQFKEVIDFYNRKKNEIYALYANCPYITPRYLKATNRFLDEFYSSINNPKKVKDDFGFPCSNNGNNITIKGLGN